MKSNSYSSLYLPAMKIPSKSVHSKRSARGRTVCEHICSRSAHFFGARKPIILRKNLLRKLFFVPWRTGFSRTIPCLHNTMLIRVVIELESLTMSRNGYSGRMWDVFTSSMPVLRTTVYEFRYLRADGWGMFFFQAQKTCGRIGRYDIISSSCRDCIRTINEFIELLLSDLSGK